jgi:hypothetical protein
VKRGLNLMGFLLVLFAVSCVWLADRTVLGKEPIAVVSIAALCIVGAVVCHVASAALEARHRDSDVTYIEFRRLVAAALPKLVDPQTTPDELRARAKTLRDALTRVDPRVDPT